MFDVEGGRETITSKMGEDVEPQIVADWIAEQAQLAGSPAANTASPADELRN